MAIQKVKYGWEFYKEREQVKKDIVINFAKKREILDKFYDMVYEEAVRALQHDKQSR